MSDDLAKFLFLGVAILVVFVGSRGTLYRDRESGQFSGLSARTGLSASVVGEVPFFILEPPQADVAAQAEGERAVQRGLSQREAVEPVLVPVEPILPSREVAIGSVDGVVGPSGFSRSGNEQAPAQKAQVTLVADLLTGEIFFELAPQKRWPLASITKLVSAAVISGNFLMHESAAISVDDFLLGAGSGGFTEGERYSFRDLISAILVSSSNVAAETSARSLGRGAFIRKMNDLVFQWGMRETYLDDPTGLSVSSQSTARDILVLAKNIYERYPTVFELTRSRSFEITEINSGKKVIINSTNLFAGQDYFVGGKTGYTDEASGNLLSVFSYKNRPIVIVVLGTDDRFGETEKLFNWFKRNYR